MKMICKQDLLEWIEQNTVLATIDAVDSRILIKGSSAAKKAWETRRKNALHKKRSDAAKKAWITIKSKSK